MRQILFFAIAILVVASVVPRFAERFGTAPVSSGGPVAAAAPVVAPVSRTSGPRSVEIARDSRGHFAVDGVVDGRRVSFMVDTGASLIALTRNDAARLGIHPAQRDYTVQVSTANGVTRAARVTLGMVEIGGVIVRDVDALISPDEALSENLLGLSFLSRLRRFEYREGRLVLEE
jgi:aspartyl protease family protein